MKSSLRFSGKTPLWVVGMIVFVLAFDLAFFWQHAADAYRSEFGGHPDEAAHVVTGLFIRDALVEAAHYGMEGFHGSPVTIGKQFANDYYSHYPKIGLGVWPPFFYLVQAAWTLVLGASTTTLLLLMAALAGGVGVLVFRALREEYGVAAAGLGVILVLSLPLVRSLYDMVMAETLSALLMFGATLAFGAFLDREQRKDALWFGVLATLAILTKGTGLALALAAPLALLWMRKFHLLKRPALWAAVLIIVIVAGPWTWATRHLGAGGWEQPTPSWNFTREALPYYVWKLGLALGLGAVPLFGLGMAITAGRRSAHRGRWVACGALIVAVVVFQSLAPVGREARHLVPALPAACVLAVAGLCVLDAWWRQKRAGGPPADAPNPVPRVGVVFWVGAILLLVPPFISSPRAAKACSGFAPIAEAMLAEVAPAEVTLVSSDATGEGMFIAEVALREKRPGHAIQRASKSLATSTWSGSGYTPAFKNDDEVFAFLTSGEIRYLVVDDSVPDAKRREHHEQIKRVVASHAERFFPVAEAESSRAGEIGPTPIRLYKITRKN